MIFRALETALRRTAGFQGSRLTSKLLSNAALNVIAGASAAAFLILVPALVSNKVSAEALSAWAVIMQPLAYVAPFTLGIQSVVARNVAVQLARDDPGEMHRVVAAAAQMMWIAAALYLGLFLVVSLALRSIYPAMPANLVDPARIALFVFALGQFVYIPLAAVSGYFLGLQKNGPVAANMVACRVLMAVAIVLLAADGALALMSSAATLASLAAAAWLWIHYRSVRAGHAAPSPQSFQSVRHSRRQMFSECLPISVWALASFAIYGGSNTVASVFDFRAYGTYTIAAGLSLLVLGLHTAAFSTLIPHVATLSVTQDARAIAHVTQRATYLSTLISLVSTVGVLVLTPALLPLVTRTIRWEELTVYLVPLLFGNALRLVALPYSNTIVALGLQGQIVMTPILEASTVLLAAILLGYWHGAMGVAWSLALGAIVSLAIHGLKNVPRLNTRIPVSGAKVILVPSAVLVVLLTPAFWILH